MNLTVNNARAYVYTGGKPFDPLLPVIVFIHGAQHDHSVWTLQSRYFAHHGYAVAAVDLPGHGRSEGKPLPSIEALAQWVIQMLDALAVRRAALVGHSMGSLIALSAASHFPERVQAIALLGCSVPMSVSEALLQAAQNDEASARTMINQWSHAASAQLGGNRVPGMWMIGANRRLMERSPPGALYVDFTACQAYADGVEAAKRIRCPALVVVGGRDIMTPEKNAQALIASLQQAQVVHFGESGHALMAEEPDALVDALREFFNNLNESATPSA